MEDLTVIGIELLLQVVALVSMTLISLAAGAFARYTGVRITEDQRTALHAVIMRGIAAALHRDPTLNTTQAAASGVSYAKRTSPALVKKTTRTLHDPDIALQETAEFLVDKLKGLTP